MNYFGRTDAWAEVGQFLGGSIDRRSGSQQLVFRNDGRILGIFPVRSYCPRRKKGKRQITPNSENDMTLWPKGQQCNPNVQSTQSFTRRQKITGTHFLDHNTQKYDATFHHASRLVYPFGFPWSYVSFASDFYACVRRAKDRWLLKSRGSIRHDSKPHGTATHNTMLVKHDVHVTTMQSHPPFPRNPHAIPKQRQKEKKNYKKKKKEEIHAGTCRASSCGGSDGSDAYFGSACFMPLYIQDMVGENYRVWK